MRTELRIAKRAGQPIEVKSVLDLRDFPGDPIQDKIVHDIDLVINDAEIDVVVRLWVALNRHLHLLRGT